jgi:hypothetical protein
MSSPSPAFDRHANAAVLLGDEATKVLDFVNQDGTRERPYITMVNTKFPERNREFHVVLIRNIKHKKHTRRMYHIRTSCDIPDYEQWEATIPDFSDSTPPVLLNRVVLIKGPSRAFWLRDMDRYNRKVACGITREELEAAEVGIEEDTTRAEAFYLLVFPQGVVLDNTIFSNDETDIERFDNDMKTEAGDTPFGTVLCGMAVWWRIAKAGGCKVEKAKKRPDPKNMFT